MNEVTRSHRKRHRHGKLDGPLDRNPDMSKADITAQLKDATGAHSVIYVEGHDPLDITLGHVDGMARFVSEDTSLKWLKMDQNSWTMCIQLQNSDDLRIERLVSKVPASSSIGWWGWFRSGW